MIAEDNLQSMILGEWASIADYGHYIALALQEVWTILM
jgi:hypothetical protein